MSEKTVMKLVRRLIRELAGVFISEVILATLAVKCEDFYVKGKAGRGINLNKSSVMFCIDM